MVNRELWVGKSRIGRLRLKKKNLTKKEKADNPENMSNHNTKKWKNTIRVMNIIGILGC